MVAPWGLHNGVSQVDFRADASGSLRSTTRFQISTPMEYKWARSIAMFQPKRYMASRIVQDVLDVNILNNAQNIPIALHSLNFQTFRYSFSNFSTFPKFKNKPFQLFDFSTFWVWTCCINDVLNFANIENETSPTFRLVACFPTEMMHHIFPTQKNLLQKDDVFFPSILSSWSHI